MDNRTKRFSRWMLTMFMACTFFVSNSLAQGELTINGVVTGDTKGFNKITINYGDLHSNAVVETTIIDGKFQAKIPYTGGVNFFTLGTQYADEMSKLSGGGVAASTGIPYDHAGVMNIEMPIALGISGAKISGMPIAMELQEFHVMIKKAHQKTERELKVKYGGRVENGDENFLAYQKDSKAIAKKNFKTVFESFIPAHSNSFASADILLNFAPRFLEPEDIKRLHGTLSRERQESTEGKEVLSYLQGIESSGIGKVVQDFALNTQAEKEFNLKSLRGKYVLIDFWASWCGPCKESFPHIKEIYSKYKDKNFEILSISIDKDKKAWLKELEKQQLPWLQVLDTKAINKSHFLVEGVPTTYLIGPDGKILIKQLGFDPSDPNGPLDEMLAEIFTGRIEMNNK